MLVEGFVHPGLSQGIASGIWAALIGAFTLAVLSLLRALQRRSGRLVNGWHYLTPGPTIWVALVGGFLCSGGFSYIYFFIGSARPDAADQMRSLFYLTVAFNLGTLACAYATVAEEIRWNDKGIERRTYLFQRRSITWHQLAAAGFEAYSGYWWVSAFDGPRIRFSPYYNGFVELMRKVLDTLPTDHPPTADVTSLNAVLKRVHIPAAELRPSLERRDSS
jgi:hypothetical protein